MLSVLILWGISKVVGNSLAITTDVEIKNPLPRVDEKLKQKVFEGTEDFFYDETEYI